MKKITDTIFAEQGSGNRPFAFDQAVAEVFDDMASRSIPHYVQNLKTLAQIGAKFYQKDSWVVDLGCSTGNSIFSFLHELKGNGKFLAVDPSAPMLEQFQQKLKHYNYQATIEFQNSTLQKADWKEPSVLLLQYVLQFLEPSERPQILKQCFDRLLPGGVLLISEKVECKQAELADLERNVYYDYKREQGYSELEISEKREALEAVLRPNSLDEQIELFKQAGFKDVLVWSKWFNFASFLCIK